MIIYVDDDVPMRHYLDMQLGGNEDGEPAPAPKKSAELNWLLLKGKYMNDCQDHELDHHHEQCRQQQE